MIHSFSFTFYTKNIFHTDAYFLYENKKRLMSNINHLNYISLSKYLNTKIFLKIVKFTKNTSRFNNTIKQYIQYNIDTIHDIYKKDDFIS